MSRIVRLLLALLCTALSSRAADLPSLASSVDAHYNHLRTLEADFTESYRGAGLDRTESGTLWLKKPGKMRWEYRSPTDKLFVTDGKDAWFYVPRERQVRRTEVKKLDDLRSPLAFLLGKTKLEKELQGLSFAPDVKPMNPDDVVLRGVPRSRGDRISQVLLEITPANQIDRILIDEVDGSTTEYRITNQKENVQLADERFQFHVPAGVEVVSEGFGQ